MFKQTSNTAFNNKLFSSLKIIGMHETTQRLYEAASALKDTRGQSAVARLLNASPQTLRNWEERGMSKPGMIAAQREIGCSANWLETGRGNMTIDGLLPSFNTQNESIGAQSNAEQGPAIGRLLSVPVVGMAQLGDNGYWAELETPAGFGDGYIPFPSKSSSAYALRCRGESMKPRIKSGEFVIINPDQPPSPGDEVLVKAKDGRVMVKELLYVRDDTVHLMSVNEAHGKLTIPVSEIDCLHQVAGIMPAHTWIKG